MSGFDTGSITHLADKVLPTGSRVICDPPVVGTDEDFVVLAPSGRLARTIDALVNLGFKVTPTPEYDGEDRMVTLRRGDTNLIVVQYGDDFDRWRAATHVAKRLNLREKADRIALFQAVLYGNVWNG